jgi:hypothetical protein
MIVMPSAFHGVWPINREIFPVPKPEWLHTTARGYARVRGSQDPLIPAAVIRRLVDGR